jgi:hypothetical protein
MKVSYTQARVSNPIPSAEPHGLTPTLRPHKFFDERRTLSRLTRPA